MKKSVLGLTVAGLLASSVAAQAEFEANVGFVSDYVWRGQSQSDNAPAIQGGLDYGWDNGVYVGVWGSSIDFADGIEFDVYGGIGGNFSEAFSWDVGLNWYLYPGDNGNAGNPNSDFDFVEVYGSLSYDFGAFALTGGAHYTPEFSWESDSGTYVYLNGDVPLPADFGLSLHVGHQNVSDNTQWGSPDWTDWSIGVSKSWMGLDFGLTYTDTNLSKTECFGGGNICDGTAVLSVGKNF